MPLSMALRNDVHNKRTYSLRKPNNEISKAMINQQNDQLFNEIVLKGTSSEDSPPRPHKQPKAKNNAVRKHSSKINRKRNLQDSFELFKENCWEKKKDGGHRTKQSVDKIGKLKEIPNMIETLSSSEGFGNSESLKLVEDKSSEYSNCRLKFKNVSNLQGQPACQLNKFDLNESIEIARESKEASRWSAKGLNYSPPVKVVLSDDDSFSSAHPSGKKKKNLAPSEENWVTISTDTKGTRSFYTDTGSSRQTSQSKYTYSYVSTYTDNTMTSKPSSNDRTSPYVAIKKMCPKLNSTTYWNKDDIGTIQFPDFISPIPVKRVAPDGKTQNQENQISKKKIQETHDENPEPKCSTQLFVSISSSQTKMFHSLSLSAIQEASKTNVHVHHQEEAIKKINKQTTVEVTQETFKADKDGEKVKSSTPHYQNVPLTLDLSPIRSPIFDDDELCMNYSLEENTDEIIVPSLIQLSNLSYDSGLPTPCCDDELNGLDGNKERHNVPKLCFDDNGRAPDQNRQVHDEFSSVTLEEMPDQTGHFTESCSPPFLLDNQYVKGAKVAQCVKGAKRAKCAKGANNAQPVKGAKVAQCVKGAKRGKCAKGANNAQPAKGAKVAQSVKGAKVALSMKGANDTQCVNIVQCVKGAKTADSFKGAEIEQSMKGAKVVQFGKGDNIAQCVKGAKNAELDCDAKPSMHKAHLNLGASKEKDSNLCLPYGDSKHTEAPGDNICAEDETLSRNAMESNPVRETTQCPAGDTEIQLHDSGYSKCFSHLNRGWLRGVCFVSKLCASSQSVLKRNQ